MSNDSWTVRINKVVEMVAGEWAKCQNCDKEIPRGQAAYVLKNPAQQSIFDEYFRFCCEECRDVFKAATMLACLGGEEPEPTIVVRGSVDRELPGKADWRSEHEAMRARKLWKLGWR